MKTVPFITFDGRNSVDIVNQERLQLFLDALRSGEFRQGKNKLYDNSSGSYCCLGVACVIAMRNGLDLNFDRDAEEFNGSTGSLPHVVAKWYGFDRTDPEVRKENGYYHLATELNDDRALSFPEIAEAFKGSYEKP